MIRIALLVGLLVGCVGTIEGEPEQTRPTDVVGSSFAPSNEGPKSDISAQGEPTVSASAPAAAVPNTDPKPAQTSPDAPPAAEPTPNAAAPAPNAAPEATEPTPNTAPAPDCVAVPAGGWICPPEECRSSWPVPSAAREDGWLDLYTRDGRQLCGDAWGHTVTDGCGRSVHLDIPCPGNDVCGGEGIWNADGTLSEERYICAECRVAEDTEGLCGGARPVLLRGCINRGNPQNALFDGCMAPGPAGVQCCARSPL